MRRAFLVAFHVLLMGAAQGAIVRIAGERSLPGQHGLAELRAALERAGHQITADEQAAVDLSISIVVADATVAEDVVPRAAEAFALRGGPGKTEIVARDAAGVMYGCMQLAEMLSLGARLDALQKVDTKAKPFHAVRGVALLVDRSALENPKDWFRYALFWQKYLDLLARCRLNLLELHAGYDAATGEWFDPLDLFVDATNKHAAANAEALSRAVSMAQRRGIRVALLLRAKPRSDRALQEGLSRLFGLCPLLDAVGFESAGSEVLDAVGKRTVIVTPAQGDRAALARLPRLPGPLRVVAPFNGDTLGLPYQVALEPKGTGASYRDLTGRPRNYELVWRLACGSTHRVFPWANHEFIRRTVEACTLGEAAGLVFEPPMAYSSQVDTRHASDRAKHSWFDWLFERNELTYEMFGRLGYDPATPRRIWADRLKAQFGNEAGRQMFDAIERSGRLVPMIQAAHCLGTDRRSIAPELQTGGDGLSGYVNAGVLDPSSIMTIAELVDDSLNGTASGKATPWDIASLLLEESQAASDAIHSAQAELLRRGDRKLLEQCECIRMDIDAVAALAGYHARKTLAGVDYEFYQRTGDHERLVTAKGHLRLAHRHWNQLAEAVGAHYKPFAQPIAMRQQKFTWRAEAAKLAADRKELDEAEETFVKTIPLAGEPPIIGHVPIARFAVNGRVELAATVRCTGKPMVIAYHREKGQAEFRAVELEQSRGKTYVSRDAIAIGTQPVEYYLEARAGGASVTLPPEGAAQPFVILPTTGNTRPKITLTPAESWPPAESFLVRASIADEAPIASAAVWFRPLPQGRAWSSAPMKRGDGDVFGASIPVTPEGVMYYVHAADANGNASREPNFLKATPYLVIPAWDKEKEGAKGE